MHGGEEDRWRASGNTDGRSAHTRSMDRHRGDARGVWMFRASDGACARCGRTHRGPMARASRRPWSKGPHRSGQARPSRPPARARGGDRRERMEEDPRDRRGEHGVDARVVGRRGPSAPGSSPGRCSAHDGHRLVPTRGRRRGAHRWLGRLSRQSSTSLSRHGHGRGWSGTPPPARLARAREWDGEHNDRQHACRRGQATCPPRRGLCRTCSAGSIRRRNAGADGRDRTPERDVSRAPGPTLPTRRPPGLSAPSRQVAGRLSLHLLLASSGAEPTSGHSPGAPQRRSGDARHGQRTHRSCVEWTCTPHLSHPTACVGCPNAARTATITGPSLQEAGLCTPSPRVSLAKGGLLPVHQ